MIERLASSLQRLIPDPFAIAMLLTLVALGAGVLYGEAGAVELIDAWAGGAKGMWALLSFSMQMCLILVTGFVVARTAPMQWLIRRLAALPRTTHQATVLVSLGAMLLALLNWGLGLIGGALLAREVGRAMADSGRPVHYPLLGAAGYTGLCVWHGGLSGSAPLKVTREADLVEVLGPELAARVGELAMTQTVFSPRNAVITLLLLLLVPLTLVLLVPRDPSRYVGPPAAEVDPPAAQGEGRGLARVLEASPVLVLPIALMMAIWTLGWLADGGLRHLNPNAMNFIFLMLGLVLAGSPRRYMELAREAARATAGVIVQFPFYAGILGILVASGLASGIAGALPEGRAALPLSTFLGAGLLNLFVPSGGGQWSIQGPLVMEAALRTGVDPGRVVMALAYGDQWTNLFQPFWALPLLGITGARAGDILGYTAILGLVVGAVFALGVTLG